MSADWQELQARFEQAGYIAEPDLAMALALMERLSRPLLIEGEAGVGKTEVAKTLAQALGRPLIRLQCYEGLDANAAVYEWNYQRQLLAIKILEAESLSAEAKESHIFQEDFLLKHAPFQVPDRPPVPDNSCVNHDKGGYSFYPFFWRQLLPFLQNPFRDRKES